VFLGVLDKVIPTIPYAVAFEGLESGQGLEDLAKASGEKVEDLCKELDLVHEGNDAGGTVDCCRVWWVGSG